MKYKIASVFVAVLALLATANVAFANPLTFGIASSTAPATTTVSQMGIGTATTTLTFDSYAPTTKTPYVKANKVALLTQFQGSTTSSVLNIDIEYSQDGLDWYQDTVFSEAGRSTSTLNISLNVKNSYTWTYASTTQITGGVAQGAVAKRVLFLPVPLRYLRVVYSNTGATSSIWASIIPIKEII